MQTKQLDIIMYIVIALIGAVTIQQASSLPEAMAPDVGPAYLPTSLAWVMIVFSVVGLLQTLFKNNTAQTTFPGMRKIIVTVISLALFFTLWQFIGYFYLLSTIFLAGLLIYYSNDGALKKSLITGCILGAVTFNVMLYFFFTFVLYTKF